MIRQMIIE